MTRGEVAMNILSEAILRRCAERAPGYDRENRFFEEDFAELKRAGYLTAPVPREQGGGGLTFAQMMREQRRLAYHAQATALGINMHVYWVGVAADLWRAGDKSLKWMLEAAVQGEVFAAGHAERGNDIPVLLSSTKAERVAGGYRFTGHKFFGSLTPAWTFLGLHGLDTSDPAAPKVVHGFMHRHTEGYSIKDTWDVLGMRATASHDTILEGAFIPDRYIARVVPAGFAGADLFILAIFQWALTGFANVYTGLARHLLDLTVERVKQKTSMGISRGSMAYHPDVQRGVAQMVMELEAIEPYLDRLADDWTNGVDHGGAWPLKIVAAKHRAVESAWKVADLALDLAGGFGIFAASGVERLVRDARLGRIHPANPALTHEIVGKLTLGISPDEQPRWG
ncbi:MAG TPA: acyl-CoA dehydrogenase family protein [Methylomirabilota bacterium]|jgi:alkylation response protein AidB-like acyl-CoA dehydrogenase